MDRNIPPAAVDEVQYAVKRLKTNKAADYMDLTSEHLKYGGWGVDTYLLNLVNFIFKTKRIPSVLKSRQITPIFKKSEKTNPSNYRGITVTSILSVSLITPGHPRIPQDTPGQHYLYV